LKVDIGFGFPSVAETVYHFAFDNQARSLTVSFDGADGELRLRSRPFQRRYARLFYPPITAPAAPKAAPRPLLLARHCAFTSALRPYHDTYHEPIDYQLPILGF